MKYYNNGEAYPMSCGCVMIPDDTHYYHYIHPECKFDKDKHTIIEGYVYRPWYQLPKHYQSIYE